MNDPGDLPHIPTDAFGRPLPVQPAVPPQQIPDPAVLQREEWKEKSHKPAALFAGLASGTIGTSIIAANLSAAQYNCNMLLGKHPEGPLCPYVMAPGFEVTPVSLILGFLLAGVGYAAVYAVVYLGNAARG